MMNIECPKCDQYCSVEYEDLPEDACDSQEFECPHCGHTFEIGWYATVELR